MWWWKHRNLWQIHTVEKTQRYGSAGFTQQLIQSVFLSMSSLSPSLRGSYTVKHLHVQVNSFCTCHMENLPCSTAKTGADEIIWWTPTVSSSSSLMTVPTPRATRSCSLHVVLKQLVGKVHMELVKNALQNHCRQCHVCFKSLSAKAVLSAAVGTAGKKKNNMPRWAAQVLDGLTAPIHSVNFIHFEVTLYILRSCV